MYYTISLFTVLVPNQINMTDVVVVSQHLLWSNWSAPSSERPIQHYEVEYRAVDSGSTDWNRVSTNPTTTSAALKNLKPGTTYQVRVRAVSDVGSGEWSIIVSRTTYNGTYVTISIGQLILIYTALCVNITSYSCSVDKTTVFIRMA